MAQFLGRIHTRKSRRKNQNGSPFPVASLLPQALHSPKKLLLRKVPHLCCPESVCYEQHFDSFRRDTHVFTKSFNSFGSNLAGDRTWAPAFVRGHKVWILADPCSLGIFGVGVFLEHGQSPFQSEPRSLCAKRVRRPPTRCSARQATVQTSSSSDATALLGTCQQDPKGRNSRLGLPSPTLGRRFRRGRVGLSLL